MVEGRDPEVARDAGQWGEATPSSLHCTTYTPRRPCDDPGPAKDESRRGWTELTLDVEQISQSPQRPTRPTPVQALCNCTILRKGRLVLLGGVTPWAAAAMLFRELYPIQPVNPQSIHKRSTHL
jgi:hypothetical protein